MKLTDEDKKILKEELNHFKELLFSKKDTYKSLKNQMDALLIDIYKIEGVLEFLEVCIKNGNAINEPLSFRKIIKQGIDNKENKMSSFIQEKLNNKKEE
jgi:hypothetical protein